MSFAPLTTRTKGPGCKYGRIYIPIRSVEDWLGTTGADLMRRKTQPLDTFTGSLVDLFKRYGVTAAILKIGKIKHPDGVARPAAQLLAN